MSFPHIFQTDRLRFEPVVETHREVIYREWASDPEVSRYVLWTTATSAADLDPYIERAKRGWAQGHESIWLITERANGEAIGSISARMQAPRVECGYVLRRVSWNRGYMTEALTAIIALGFSQPDIYRIGAICDVENGASARVMEKAGLKREGLCRSFVIHPQASPKPRDVLVYGLARETN